MLNASQIKWASQHDWFIRDNGNGTIDVLDHAVDVETGEEFKQTVVWWCDFKTLREWAGY